MPKESQTAFWEIILIYNSYLRYLKTKTKFYAHNKVIQNWGFPPF